MGSRKTPPLLWGSCSLLLPSLFAFLSAASPRRCGDLREIRYEEFLGSGWTKSVFRARLPGGDAVAVKKVNVHGHDVTRCIEEGGSPAECCRGASAKILKEIEMLRILDHPNVVKLCVDLGRLIHHLAMLPKGPAIMNDFRRQQFVMCGETLKLSDVDDLVIGEKPCETDEDCSIRSETADVKVPIPCDASGFCRSYNEKMNIFNAGRHFTTFLLPPGAPNELRPLVGQIVSAYTFANWSSRALLEASEGLLNQTSPGLRTTAAEQT